MPNDIQALLMRYLSQGVPTAPMPSHAQPVADPLTQHVLRRAQGTEPRPGIGPSEGPSVLYSGPENALRRTSMALSGYEDPTAMLPIAGMAKKFVDPAVQAVGPAAKLMQSIMGRVAANPSTGPATRQEVALAQQAFKNFAVPPQTMRTAVKGEPGFAYHLTNPIRLNAIAEGKGLAPRSAFSENPQNLWKASPEQGNPIILRTKLDKRRMRSAEGGGRTSASDIKADALEYLGTDGQWHTLPKLIRK